MTTSIRSGSADGALQLNGVDQITMQATQVLLTKPIAAPVGATGQLVTFDQVGGLGQTWQAVTRVTGTTYTNTTSKPIFGTYQGQMTTISANPFVTMNGINQYGSQAYAANQTGFIFTIIPPGASYTLGISAGTWAINAVELR